MLILCAAVTLWVGGFDVLYACQDVEYDRSAGLFSDSAAVWSGAGAADCASDARRRGDFAPLAGGEFWLPWPAWVGIAVVAALLAYEHSLVKADDLSKLDAAFFTMNGYISISFLVVLGRGDCAVAGLKRFRKRLKSPGNSPIFCADSTRLT